MWLLLGLLLPLLSVSVSGETACEPRSFGTGRIVCVCNATYCDTIDPVSSVPQGEYLLYTTTKDGLRFSKTTGSFEDASNTTGYLLAVDPSVKYQSIIGFGTAFTDAAGINTASLSTETQENLLRSYFSSDGIELNMGRVPIAGCDFSTHTYTYDDYPGDVNLANFSLTEEDFKYKFPYINWAKQLSPSGLKLLSAAWSAPPWMKTNDDYSGFGFLKKEFYQTWSNYLMKFLDEYKKNGHDFWGISTGNEPINGIIPINRFNSLGWLPSEQAQFVAENFGPALRNSQHKDVKLLALDDQRFMLPWWINYLMVNEVAAGYIDGTAVHWYWDYVIPPGALDSIHNTYPNKILIQTEASNGDKPWDLIKVKLGSWNRGEAYMADILENLQHWVQGWIDWNFVLDGEGGPNWANNFVDSAVIANSTTDEFYKQPTFYAIGHFSKFIPEGSVRISTQPERENGITTVGFLRPDNAITIVMYNEKDSNTRVSIKDPNRGYINLLVPKRSFSTFVYW